jgi:hypothetical protein
MAACETAEKTRGFLRRNHGLKHPPVFLRREDKQVTKSEKERPDELGHEGESPYYHCSSLTEATLRTPSPDRPFFIRLNSSVEIYVDQHDYNLYVRPLESEARTERRRERCVIAGKRCNEDCSQCPFPRTGRAISMEEQFEKYELEYADQSESIVDSLAQEELIDAMLREIGALPKEDQTLLRLLAAGHSTRSIARAVGKPHRTVWDRIHKLTESLREKLEPYR